MSHQQENEAEEMEEEYDMEDADDEFVGRDAGGSDSDMDEYEYMDNRMQDTTASQAREGRDIQGIPWERLSITREKYRQTRLEQYKNYENIPHSGEGSEKECKSTEKGGLYYVFRRNSRSVKSTILHFQLRNLYLDRPGVSYCTRTTYEDNAITNAVEIYTSGSGAVHFIASNNDNGVRDFDMEKFQQSNHFRFMWPVNHTSLSPDGKLLVIVGDDPVGMLVDSRTGKAIASFHGHLDYTFASAWHPGGLTFATGNQDKTCRIWDIRNLSTSVTALKGNIGAIRSIHYTSDGSLMAMAEPADFVHVFDVDSGYEKEQEIDFFGEISGMSFSPDTESLFIGVWDRTYASLLEFGRRRDYSYLDVIF